jgi:hypothetical protein
MASIGDDWDDKNADAVSGTYVNALGIAGMIFGLKTSVKPSPVPTAARDLGAAPVPARPVPDPAPVLKPNGAADRSSAVYINVRRADGNHRNGRVPAWRDSR